MRKICKNVPFSKAISSAVFSFFPFRLSSAPLFTKNSTISSRPNQMRNSYYEEIANISKFLPIKVAICNAVSFSVFSMFTSAPLRTRHFTVFKSPVQIHSNYHFRVLNTDEHHIKQKLPKKVAEWRLVVSLLSLRLISAPFFTSISIICSSPNWKKSHDFHSFRYFHTIDWNQGETFYQKPQHKKVASSRFDP